MPGDLDLVRRLAATTHLAVLATTRPDGTVQASLVSAGVLDDPVTGRPTVAAVLAGTARKIDHLRRTGRGAAVFHQGYEWVAVEGPARLIGPDDPDDAFPRSGLAELLRRVFIAAGGTHDDWDAYDRVMAAERRVAVFIDPVRITGNN